MGEIVSTGDDLQDVRKFAELLKSKGMAAAELPAHEGIRKQAVAFKSAVHAIRVAAQAAGFNAGPYIAPIAANTGLAVELFLKALSLKYGKKAHGHDVLRIFNDLPPRAIERVRCLSHELRSAEGEDANFDFGVVLGSLSRTFVNWRYAHEHRELHFPMKEADFVLALLERATLPE